MNAQQPTAPCLEWHDLTPVGTQHKPMRVARAVGPAGDFLLTTLPEVLPVADLGQPGGTSGEGPWHLRVLSNQAWESHLYLVRVLPTREAAIAWCEAFESPGPDARFEERARTADDATGLTRPGHPLTGTGEAEPLVA